MSETRLTFSVCEEENLTVSPQLRKSSKTLSKIIGVGVVVRCNRDHYTLGSRGVDLKEF